MHIHKLFAVMSVAAIAGAGSLKAQNSDTDAQAKAREALRQTISQLNSGATNVTPATPAPSSPVPVAPPAAPAPAPADAAPAAVAPAPAPADAATIAVPSTATPVNQLTPEQEQQLIQQERDLVRGHTQPTAPVAAPATTATVNAAATPAAAVVPTVAVPQTSVSDTGAPIASGTNLTPAQEDELVKQERELIYKRNKATVVDGNAGWPKTEYPAQMANTNLSMMSGSKQQKLDELLQLYRDDMITPMQYHQQRAKIIEEP